MSSEQQNPFEPTGQPGRPFPPPPSNDPTGGLIPLKNVPALIAYYLGIFSLVPCFGSLLCVPALLLGIMGLAKAKKNPEVKGGIHAWIGVILGGLVLLGTIAVAILVGMAAIHQAYDF